MRSILGHHMATAAAACAVLLALQLPGRAQGQITGFEGLVDWASLPLQKPGTSGMLSSYDTRGTDATAETNVDYTSSFVGQDVPGTGPGVVNRFWTPHIAANAATPLRLIVDGGSAGGGYTISTNTRDFFKGDYGNARAGNEFRPPLVQTLVGGQVSYEPITFQRSFRLEMDTAPTTANFFQLGYTRLPAGTAVPSYNGALTARQQADRATAVGVVDGRGSNPAGAGGASVSTAGQTIPAGGTLSLANLSGSGQIRALNLKLRGVDASTTLPNAQLDGLKLRVRYDGQAANAIDVPVSHFFGVGHGRADYRSLPLGVRPNDGTYYSYWPMPYRNGAQVELVNTTGSAITVPASSVESASGPVAADALYLHAEHREQTTVAGQVFYNILNATGQRGHYVGNMLYRGGNGGAQTLEGDEVITIDGSGVLHGTGLEDTYNGGYYYNHLNDPRFQIRGDASDPPFPYSGDAALHGLLAFPNFDRSDQYRWQITDAVPFTTGINVNLENFGQGGGNLFGSTAFYYSNSSVPEPASAVMSTLPILLLLARRSRNTAVS